MAESYHANDMQIIAQHSTSRLVAQAELGTFTQTLAANLDSRYMVDDVFPTISMLSRAFGIELSSLVYNDATVAKALRAINRGTTDKLVTFALIHEPALRFGPYGTCLLGSTPLADDGGLLTLSNTNPGSGKVQFRKLVKVEAAVSTGITIANPPPTILVDLQSAGTTPATAITLKVTIGSTEYIASVGVVPALQELTLLNGTAQIPASAVTGDLTVETTPSTASGIVLYLGYENP